MRRSALALLLGCLLLVAGVSALDSYDYYQTIEYAACDQETYQQDIVIHRTTGTAYNETAGGLETWHIFIGEHSQEDYSDIRFTDAAGNALAYYLWPDYDAESARFCVRLSGADSAGSLQVWYGNPSATTTSDPDATYPLIDNFDGSALNTILWDVSGSPTVADGAIKFYGTSCKIASKQTFTPGNYLIQVRFKNHAQSGDIEGRLYSGFVPLSNNGNGAVCFSTTPYPRLCAHYVSHITAWSSQIDTWYEAVILKSADNKHTVSVGTTTSVSNIAVVGNTVYLGGAYVHSSVDWIIVRAYSATPPAALTFSGEQSAPVPLVTAFTATPLAGTAPLTVQFTDRSTGGPTSWLWDFGDGTTSITQNPQHTYTTAGAHTVTLTASHSYDSDTETKTAYITVAVLRPKTTAPIPTLDESPYLALTGAFGGNNQLNESTEGVDWLGMKDAAERPYTDAIGPFFYVIVFAIPFLMQWLRQGSMAVPAAIGIILGGIMLAKTPAEYHLAAIAFIALSILAVVWGVIKDRN